MRPDFAEYAFIESLKSYHYGTVMTYVFSVFGEKMLRKAASVKGIMDGSYQKDYISDDMKYVLSSLCKKNTELLRQQIIDCQCIVLEGYDHGELSIGNPEKHTKMLRMWMKDGNIAKGDWDE